MILYEIVKELSKTACLALKDNKVFFLKKICLEDVDIHKKLTRLNHKNIVKIYELTTVDNEFFAVCEYINGRTLSNIVESSGPMNREDVKKIVYDICDGLEAVHSLGIIHRDISPNNIIIDDEGTAKIIDFGISRLRKNNGSSDTQILGTQGYAAPEQYGFKQTSNKADIYSLGVLINYLCTGLLPNQMIAGGEFSEIILKCTQMDENQRYSNVQEVKNAIDRKYRLYSFIKKIPGFRKDVLWHKIIAVIYYVTVLLFFVFPFFSTELSKKDLILFIQFVFFGMLLPVPIIFDYNNWLEKVPYTRNKTKSGKIFFKITLAGLIALASTIILGLL